VLPTDVAPAGRPAPDPKAVAMAVKFRVLGEIEAWIGPAETPLGHSRQRCVLAILLAEPNRVVSVAELIERVWGERPPPSARESVYSYLSRLRHLVTGITDAQLIRRSGGYLIVVDPLVIDMHLFRHLRLSARDGDDATAAAVLDRALSLWRGEAFARLDTPWINALREELDRQRFAAQLDRNDLALRAGRYADLLAELRAAVAAHPLDERLAGQLMVALHSSGRQGDALQVYQDVRRRLVDGLGAEPSVPLRELHQRMLAGNEDLPVVPASAGPYRGPSHASVPRQLPSASRSFTGRTRELAALDGLLPGSGSSGNGVAVVIVSGAGGVGKTALAVHWAHRSAGRFPDGQLYVDLRGFDPSDVAVAPGEAMRGFLEALGVHHQRVPADLEAQTRLYRSLLVTRRMLVVLDNARDVDQVRPLLPGAPSCPALVTSRRRLTGLVAADSAVELTLDLLDPEEARALLTARVGAARVAAEPRAVDEIILLCARLALALAIVAARAATQRGLRLATLVEQLRTLPCRLDALEVGDTTTDVRAVFSWSYRALRPDVARLFRLLGVHPGPDISASAAASLTGGSAMSTRAALDELTRANLLTEPAPGRYTFHDLLRAYARELAQSEDPSEEQDEAVHRMLSHYLQSANVADHVLYPHRDVVELPDPQPGVVHDDVADADEALDWFTIERQVLHAVACVAAGSQLDTYTWQLALTMVNYLTRRGHWDEWIIVQDRALQAAARHGDRQGEAFAHRGMQRAYLQCGRRDDADLHGRQALHLFCELGDRAGQAQTYLLLGAGAVEQGRNDEGLRLFLRAQDLYREVGHEAGRANALNNAGFTYVLLGKHEQALALCRLAISLQQKVGDRYMEGFTWDSLGYAHYRLGRHRAAIASYRNALRLLREQGERYLEADTLARLADAHDAAGDGEVARRSRRHALEIYEDLGHPDLEALRGKLTDAGAARQGEVRPARETVAPRRDA
jgi:DNA-binding SARP family transcriptional activator/tetratricopeptide (TPR) repeat protein